MTTFVLPKPVCEAVASIAITALLAPAFIPLYERYQERHDALYLPVSSAPDQPHPPHNGTESIAPTTMLDWGASGTNTSAANTSTTWTTTTLLLPSDSNPYVVTRLEQAGLTVAVSILPAYSPSTLTL
jgi:hypothetical protein